jgi:hypothetical protein
VNITGGNHHVAANLKREQDLEKLEIGKIS